MAKFTDSLDEKLIAFIQKQHMFFTASATADSRINLSPKGMDSFRILDNKAAAYLDYTGSGNETAAHIAHDGRLTIMFCSFDEKPLILRLYGRGEVIHPDNTQWDQLIALFSPEAGARQIIKIHIESVQTSCGYSVPEYEFKTHRKQLVRWAEKKGEDGIRQYWQDKNQTSIDGLEVATPKV